MQYTYAKRAESGAILRQAQEQRTTQYTYAKRAESDTYAKGAEWGAIFRQAQEQRNTSVQRSRIPTRSEQSRMQYICPAKSDTYAKRAESDAILRQAQEQHIIAKQLQESKESYGTSFEARQLIEALRVGVAPAQVLHGQGLTVGLQEQRASLIAGLDKAHKMGGAVRAVMGHYGVGKTHLVEWTMQEALARDFLVATTSLDLLERPPHRSFKIYRSLIAQLRYPNTQERGLGPLFKQADQMPAIIERYYQLAPLQWDPLFVALHAFSTTNSQRQRHAWQAWLEGGKETHFMSNIMPHHLKFPTIYKVGHNARQIGYLLGSLSLLARLSSYSGLCILLDEAESYSRLHRKQRPKATTFFKAMIYSALGEQQEQIKANSLPQLRSREYPATFGKGQALFFLFTTTHSQNSLPLERWLNEQQILTLNPHYNPKQISHFLQKVQQYHQQAYNYQPDKRQGQIRRAAAEHLALGMRKRSLSIRDLVRLAVELFDLLYLYPDYQAVELLTELRKQMRG